MAPPVFLVLQPGFPAEVPFYVRGLKQAGAVVLGVGDQPQGSLPEIACEGLDAYLQVGNLWDAEALTHSLRNWDVPVRIDRIMCFWEVAMELAAELREAFGVPGLTSAHTRLFRDKYAMRKALENAGIPQPGYGKASSADEVLSNAKRIGFPLIIKPASGAGSAKTWKVHSMEELRQLLPAYSSTSDVVLEEMIEGDEYTYDTICGNGRILYENILRYTPTMLQSRSIESISPQNMICADLTTPLYRKARELGHAVLKALEFDSGMTHMEWFAKPDGSVVFGEIGARPPGGMTGELMCYCSDFDIYRALGQAFIHGRIRESTERIYNVAIVFKRAVGQGRIQHIEGLEGLYRDFGEHIIRHELLPIGSSRRNWKQTLLSDGFLILRHRDLATATAMSQEVADRLKIYTD